MDRVLLLMTTATYKATAFLDAARKMGLGVVVGTERPQALADLNPQGHLTLDFADPERSASAAATFAGRAGIGAVVAADDDGAVLATAIARALGLPHSPVDAVRAARSKLLTRERLQAAGLPTPWFERVSLDQDPAVIATRIQYPCVIKPLALSASRGVMRANDHGEFVTAFHRLANLLERPDARAFDQPGAAGALIEGYIPGVEVAVEGLLTRGEMRVLAIFDKPDPLEGPFFEETIYVTPSRLPAETQRTIAEAAAAGARALRLEHGPVHAEIRINASGPWVLEIAPRSIGGLCSRALRFEGGMSLEELILLHALGRGTAGIALESRASGVMMIPIPAAGVLEEVQGVAEARQVPGVVEVRITLPSGQRVEPPPEGSRYLGFIFARASRPEEVETALRAAHQNLSIAIRPVRADDPADATAAQRTAMEST